MLFTSVNSYFAIDNPCLHYEKEKEEFNLNVFFDYPYPILTIPIDHFSENELNVLFYEDVELNALCKDELILPMWKFGNDGKFPFLFGTSIDPNAPQNYQIVDSLINSDYLLICFVCQSTEYNTPAFKGFRMLRIQGSAQLTLGKYFLTATELGLNYSLKYFNWIQNEVKKYTTLERWEKSVKLGVYTDVTIEEVKYESNILSLLRDEK